MITLTNHSLSLLFNAILALNSAGLKLSGRTRLALAKNLRIAREALRDFETAAEGLEGAEKRAVLLTEVSLPLAHIKIDDLNLEENPAFTTPVIEGILPIIE